MIAVEPNLTNAVKALAAQLSGQSSRLDHIDRTLSNQQHAITELAGVYWLVLLAVFVATAALLWAAWAVYRKEKHEKECLTLGADDLADMRRRFLRSRQSAGPKPGKQE